MRKLLLAGATTAALAGLAGIGHNIPPAVAAPVENARPQAVLPKRIVDEQRQKQKLKQKRRKAQRRQYLNRFTRAQRKEHRFGSAYRPGKLFKGHRI